MVDMAKKRQLELPAKAENLEKIFDWIEASCAAYDPAKQFMFGMQLVVEELFLNVLNHSAETASADGRVSLTFSPQPNGIMLVFSDDGSPFDPLSEAPEPDTDAAIEDRKIGGLGLKLVREIPSQLSYNRTDWGNQLTLIFNEGE
ncbi:MAG: ATP-binding protein [Aestuariivita sp.]|nr:ATP-binding protein [Aestuariivita sp.]MCY4346159.1 ATP-binding protein [Aestuariivita sp.]